MEPTETNPSQKLADKNSKPITQVQRDSVITSEDLPPKAFRISLTIATLAIVLLFFGFYFGIINV